MKPSSFPAPSNLSYDSSQPLNPFVHYLHPLPLHCLNASLPTQLTHFDTASDMGSSAGEERWREAATIGRNEIITNNRMPHFIAPPLHCGMVAHFIVQESDYPQENARKIIANQCSYTIGPWHMLAGQPGTTRSTKNLDPPFLVALGPYIT